MGVRAGVALIAVTLSSGVVWAAPPNRIDDVVTRMLASIDRFATQAASIVGEEDYRQQMEITPAGVIARAIRDQRPRPTAPAPEHSRRRLRSDYALVRASDRGDWVGFRDTFAVDDRAVRDREDRLQRLLTTGAMGQAERIANESARFNLGSDFVVRNINVPTLVWSMLQRGGRDRFSFRKRGEELIDGINTWRVDFRERDRPTIIRTPEGRDQPSHGSVWVVPETGDIRRTAIVWDAVRSSITATFQRVDALDAVVPVAMSERYERDGAIVTGDATYSNFRRFQTGARLVVP